MTTRLTLDDTITTLAKAAQEVLDAHAALNVAYVPTASNSRPHRDVMAARRQRVTAAHEQLQAAVFAATWPIAYDDGSVVHRVRADYRTVCMGTAEDVDLWDAYERSAPTAAVLTSPDRACPDCNWGLS